MDKPIDLHDAIDYFSDVDVATDYVAALRWPHGWVCPHCGGSEYSYLSTRRLWKCKACKKQSSVKVGTIFEGSPLGLDKWLPAIWLAANPEYAISSHELARELGTTQKSAWFMLRRIAEAETTTAAEPPPVELAPPVPAAVPAPAAAVELPAERDRFELPSLPLVPGWLVSAVALGAFVLGVVVGRLTRGDDRLT